MKRFFGMMPRDEIEIEKRYESGITIQAGPHGWTILYVDSSSEYKDVDRTTEENFKEAFETVEKRRNEML